MKIHRVLKSGLILGMAAVMSTACTDDPIGKTNLQPGDVLLQLSFAPVSDIKADSRAGNSFFHQSVRDFGSENENVIDDATIVIYDTPLNQATDASTILKVFHMATTEFTETSSTTTAKQDVTLHYYLNDQVAAVPGKHRLVNIYTINEEFGKTIVGDIIALGGDNGRDLYAMAFANLSPDAKAFIRAGVKLTALRDYVYRDPLYANDEIHIDEDGNPYSQHAAVQKTDQYGNLLWDANDPTKPQMWTPSKTGLCSDGRRHVCYKDCYHFVMSAANEIKFNTKPVQQNSGGVDVDIVEMTTTNEPLVVKRLAARIDLAFGDQAMWNSNPQLSTTIDSEVYDKGVDTGHKYDVEVLMDGTYLFPIYDEQYYRDHHTEAGFVDRRITGGLVKMWGIEMKNVVTTDEYLIQRAIQGGTTVYFGTDGEFVDDYSTNFIPSVEGRKYTDYALAHVSGKWNGQTFSPGTDISPVGFIEPALFLHPKFDQYERAWPFAYFSILGYYAENTFRTHNANNKYTTMTIKANINISGDLIKPSRGNASDDEGNHDYHTAECIIPVKVNIPIRHCFGDATMVDPSQNMAYAIVRNTIYRMYIRFYAMGSDLIVRYYYYDGSDSNLVEAPYPSASTTVNINPFIQESPGTAMDD